MSIKNMVHRIMVLCRNVVARKYFICNVCNRKINKFERLPDFFEDNLKKYEYIHPVDASETMNREQYSCPFCGSADRERLYVLYLDNYLNQISNKENFKLLDVAPSPSVTKWIKKLKWINYRTVDLYMTNVDDNADITNLSIYSNEQFDFILCSHVLEHIENDLAALSELYRVLKFGAKAIIMVPILLTINKDLENPEYTSTEDRWKYYGQHDHVRMYSKKGFIEKMEKVGFNVLQLDEKHFGKEQFGLLGIHHRSVLYVVEKL